MATIAALRGLRGFARNQLVEVAPLPTGSLVLDEKRESAFIELLEEIVPRDGFERTSSAEAGEVEAQDAGIFPAARSPDTCGLGIALFRPATYLVVIRHHSCCCACCHGLTSL